jgi:hypothetical protein
MAKDIEALTGTDATDFGKAVRKHFIPDTTVPVSSNFTWVNQGSASVTDIADVGMHMNLTYTLSESLRCLVQTMPATPFTVEVIFQSTQTRVNFNHCGLVIRDSSGGRCVTLGTGNNSGLFATTHRYTTTTSYSADGHFFAHQAIATPLVGVRLSDNGTNQQAYISFDGLAWVTAGSAVSRTAWVAAPDQIGVYFNNNSAASTVTSGGIMVKSFRTF